jgi:hypothetical protein
LLRGVVRLFRGQEGDRHRISPPVAMCASRND